MGFLVQFLCRVAVIVVTAAVGIGHWPSEWLTVHLLVELAPAVGSVLNVLRLPEAWAPGHPLFAYVLQSHTIMHVLVAIGMLGNHYIALNRAAHVAATPHLLACAAANTDAVTAAFLAPLELANSGLAWAQGALGQLLEAR